MIFKAYLVQDCGCDYTIGCGRIVIDIEANDLDEALGKLYHKVKEDFNFDDNELISCELYEINNVVSCDLKNWKKRFENDLELEEQRKTEERELREYNRLKAKFGDI